MEKQIFITTLCVPDVPTAEGNVAERKNFHKNKNFVSSRKWKNEFSLQPYVFQMYRQQKAMSLKGKIFTKTKILFLRENGKTNFHYNPMCSRCTDSRRLCRWAWATPTERSGTSSGPTHSRRCSGTKAYNSGK